jgi:hypothetical protein
MEKQVELCAANITSIPHPPGIYRDLIFRVFQKRLMVSYIGSDKIMPGNIEFNEDDNSCFGSFIVFTEIEFSGEWLDLKTLAKASTEKIQKIIIPDDIRPNLRFCNFFFDFKKHKISFEVTNEDGKKFSAVGIQRALRNWLSSAGLDVTIDVTILPRHDALSRIFALKKLNKLVIKVMLPNPDDVEDPYARVVQLLEDQKAKSLELSLEKQKGKSTLEPSPATRRLAEAASENGFVEARGIGDDGRVHLSTKNYPMTEFITRRGLIQATLADWLRRVVPDRNQS